MNALEMLLDKRYVIKNQDKELYYQVKDEIEIYKKFIRERLGYQLIINPHLIKLEKIPVEPAPWMGILEFGEKIHYIFFCLILMFLEDKEVEEQFVLSALTEYIQQNYQEGSLDWTLYQNRRNLITVIKYCINEYLIVVTDGVVEEFSADEASEVLYENTGVSRYVMRNFHKSIVDYHGMADFLRYSSFEDRGALRRQRVFQKLLLTPGVYRESDEDEDFNYIRQYRGVISEALKDIVEGELQVHKTSAYLVQFSDNPMGITFPGENTLSDIVLLTFQIFMEKVEKGEWQVEVDERIYISINQLQMAIEDCIREHSKGFVKTYREMPTRKLFQEVCDFLELYDFITIENEQDVVIKPIARKICGRYPEDYHAKQ